MMRVLLQRVTRGCVRVDGRVVGAIERGLVLLAAAGHLDTPRHADMMADKVAGLRIFNNDEGKIDRSLLDIGGGALVVSQFTLYGDARKGRRPNFEGAARPEAAEPLIERFRSRLAELGINPVASGVFGAKMEVEIINDGPVTIWLDTADWGSRL